MVTAMFTTAALVYPALLVAKVFIVALRLSLTNEKLWHLKTVLTPYNNKFSSVSHK